MSAAANLRRRRARWSAGLVAMLLAAWALSGRLPAQVVDSPWRTVDAGGGVSALGVYSVSGTTGQPDAGAPLLAGSYRLEGGFWPGAVALSSNLIFADGFASGYTTAWTVTVPLGGDPRRAAP